MDNGTAEGAVMPKGDNSEYKKVNKKILLEALAIEEANVATSERDVERCVEIVGQQKEKVQRIRDALQAKISLADVLRILDQCAEVSFNGKPFLTVDNYANAIKEIEEL